MMNANDVLVKCVTFLFILFFSFCNTFNTAAISFCIKVSILLFSLLYSHEQLVFLIKLKKFILVPATLKLRKRVKTLLIQTIQRLREICSI